MVFLQTSKGSPMNNLSTAANTDISSLIGALELGDHLAGHGDDVLETFALGGTQTRMAVAACIPMTVRCVSDGALEATMAGPALTTAMCPRIDDGVLVA
jgi:hypothetical protein